MGYPQRNNNYNSNYIYIPSGSYGGYNQQSNRYSYRPLGYSYGNNNRTAQSVQRSRGIALLLWYGGGILALHNFYLGRVNKGIYIIIYNVICTILYVFNQVHYGIHQPNQVPITGVFLIASSIIFLLFLNWVKDFFLIVTGTIKDDKGYPAL